MKKWLLALALLVLVPSTALAAEVRSAKNQLTLGSGETIQDDVYATAGMVTVSSNIGGDLTVAGGTIRVDGNVTQDVLAAGGQVTLNGNVGDDVRMAGGTLQINGAVGGDLLVAGGNVEIGENAVIKGQVFVGGGSVVIAGHTGAIKAAPGSLELTKTAVVNGDLNYRSSQAAVIDSAARVTGHVNFNQIQARHRANYAAVGMASFFSLLLWLSGFILAGLFMLLAPSKTEKLVKNWRSEFWTNLLTGFLFMVAAPVAAVILMITVIGLPLGIGLLILIPILIFIGKLVTIFVLGCWAQKLWNKETPDRPTWLAAFVGSIILMFLGIIPLLGWLAIAVVGLTSLGALIRYDWNLLKTLRQNQSL